MKTTFCLLVLISTSLVLASSGPFDATIEGIIAKHWQKHLDRLPEEKRAIIAAQPKTVHNEWEYDCVQDDLSAKMKTKLTPFAKGSKLPAPESVQARDVAPRQTYQSERFYINNTYLTQTDPRACYTVGQTVAFGDDPVGSCVNDGDDECFYTCKTEDILSTSLQAVIRDDVMPAVIEVFENMLTIKRVTGNLLLNAAVWNAFQGECYSGIPIPSSLVQGMGSGLPDTDMLVIPAARPAPNEGTVAYALACNFDWDQSSNSGFFGRPLAGHVNFNPRYFQRFATPGYSEFDFHAAVKVGVHEFTHAMGFSSGFYQSYRDPSTGAAYPGYGTKQITKTGTTPSGTSWTKQVQTLTTPRMLALAQKHYNCPTLQGVELEDYGGSGTAGSHWELRMVQNEYMAGYINSLMPVSYLTMSLFEDMGWYSVDYTKAEYWTWGKGQGCDWATQPCQNSWTGAGYFCTSSTQKGCTADRQAKGSCYVGDWGQALPAYYQHFSNPQIGGGNPAADFCPFTDYTHFCRNISETADPTVYEQFGSDSLCWEIGANAQQLNQEICYNHRCVDQALQVQINNNWVSCPANGGTVSVPAINGVVNCPSSYLVCGSVELPPPIPDSDSSHAETQRATVAFLVLSFGFCLFFQELIMSLFI